MIIFDCCTIFYSFLAIFGGFQSMFNYFPDQRNVNLNFTDHGLGDGKSICFLANVNWRLFFVYVLL